MELTKKDFYLSEHKKVGKYGSVGGLYTHFNNADIQHRFGGNNVADNKFQIRPQSCGNPCKVVRIFDTWTRALNGSFGFEPQSYKESVLEFNSIENANEFIDNLFKVIQKYKLYRDVASHILSKNGTLPKGIIALRNERNFRFFKVDKDNNFKITLIDYEHEYLKYHKTDDDLYHYDFNTMKVVQNKKCKAWV